MSAGAIIGAVLVACVLLLISWRYARKSTHPVVVGVVKTAKRAKRAVKAAVKAAVNAVNATRAPEAVKGAVGPKFGRCRR